MKVKRHKRVRKFLAFYKVSSNIKPPFKVVVDGEFLQAALEGKIQVAEQIPKLTMEPTTTYVTKCVMEDLRQKGSFYRGAVMIGEKLPHLKCAHGGLKSPLECIKMLIGDDNKEKLFVGAQDLVIRKHVRKCPGAPLLYIRGQVPLMEAPSNITVEENVEKGVTANTLTKKEREYVASVQREGDDGNIIAPIRKRKKVKGANPLSQKKKKTAQPQKKQNKNQNQVQKQQQTNEGKNEASNLSDGPSSDEKKTPRTNTEKQHGSAGNDDIDNDGADNTNPEKGKRKRRKRSRKRKTNNEQEEES